jgi:hypothetical protein
MSIDEMLWVILQDRRRQAADAARERLARRAPDADPRSETTESVGRMPADNRTLRPAEGAPGR